MEWQLFTALVIALVIFAHLLAVLVFGLLLFKIDITLSDILELKKKD